MVYVHLILLPTTNCCYLAVCYIANNKFGEMHKCQYVDGWYYVLKDSNNLCVTILFEYGKYATRVLGMLSNCLDEATLGSSTAV